MQCLVCKHLNPEGLRKCERCDSEIVPKREAHLPYQSYLLCDPMSPIKLEIGKTYSFGREHTCTIVLSSGSISRINTVFENTPAGVTVFDNDSRNGTFLNGIKLISKQPAPLKDKDEIRVGPYNLKYRYIQGRIEDYLENQTSEVLLTEDTMDIDTGEIGGDLAKNKCADILQMIGITKKTGMLEIHVKGGKGIFYFRDGNAVHATFFDFIGVEAAHKMIPLNDGTFKFHSLETLSISQTINVPTHRLILDSLRIYDEDSRKLPKGIPTQELSVEAEILKEQLSNHIPKFDFFADLKKKDS
ncbi:MAG: DUF4388 domain-containing protein [Planctomycetota bacterium]|mgnify:CR=1 FL=1